MISFSSVFEFVRCTRGHGCASTFTFTFCARGTLCTCILHSPLSLGAHSLRGEPIVRLVRGWADIFLSPVESYLVTNLENQSNRMAGGEHNFHQSFLHLTSCWASHPATAFFLWHCSPFWIVSHKSEVS